MLAKPATRGMDGFLRAVVTGPAPGRLTGLEHRVPLQAQRLLYPEPDVAHLCVLSPTGGVLQGDRLRLDVTSRDGARLHVATQSATRVYRMPDAIASQSVRLCASGGAYLEYLPHPVIAYAGSHFEQRLQLHAERGGIVVASDAFVPGRLSRGERWELASYTSRVQAYVDGELVLAECGSAAPGPATMGPWAVAGSLYVVGARPVVTLPDLAGSSALRGDLGLVVRAVGETRAQCAAVLREAWDQVRRALISRPAHRIWD